MVAESVFERTARLRDHLWATVRASASPSLWGAMDEAAGIVTSPTAPAHPDAPVHAVISYGEINHDHGTGVLVERVFRGRSGVFSIRFRDDWGRHDFGDWHIRLPLKEYTHLDSALAARRLVTGRNVKTVTCVPFTAGELQIALAVQKMSGAKLCVWIMDDQNVASGAIPDAVMRECLEACSLRLTTHPELRDAYQQKYGLDVYILPAVVPAELVRDGPPETSWDGQAKTAALLGSIWDQCWFDRLCEALSHCDCATDWYGQNHSPWLKFPEAVLSRAHTTAHGVVPENQLANALRRYPFVIVPAGMLDGRDSNPAIAALSLPGRILFAVASAHTPILVVGSDRTCAARFVREFEIGLVAPYEAKPVALAIDCLRDSATQKKMRANAAAIGSQFSDRGVAEWLSASTEQGRPVDRRFEDAFSQYNFSLKEM